MEIFILRYYGKLRSVMPPQSIEPSGFAWDATQQAANVLKSSHWLIGSDHVTAYRPIPSQMVLQTNYLDR